MTERERATDDRQGKVAAALVSRRAVDVCYRPSWLHSSVTASSNARYRPSPPIQRPRADLSQKLGSLLISRWSGCPVDVLCIMIQGSEPWHVPKGERGEQDHLLGSRWFDAGAMGLTLCPFCDVSVFSHSNSWTA